jgi:hypothetical protein
MRQRGYSLIQAMLYVAVCGVLLGAVAPAFVTLHEVSVSTGSDWGDAFQLRQFASNLGTRIRSAVPCDVTAGCTGLDFASVELAEADRVRFYITNAGATREIKSVPGVGVTLTEGGKTQTIIPGAAATFRYVVSPTNSYNLAGDPYTEAFWSNSVTGSNRLQVAAVAVDVTRTEGGTTLRQSTWVRLRNSPVKRGDGNL